MERTFEWLKESGPTFFQLRMLKFVVPIRFVAGFFGNGPVWHCMIEMLSSWRFALSRSSCRCFFSGSWCGSAKAFVQVTASLIPCYRWAC